MRHPKRSITRETRTRRPRHPGRQAEELEAIGWPEAVVRVSQRMSRPAVRIRWDAPVAEAFEVMRTRRIRHLPVVDEADGLVGIVTDRDLRQLVFDPAIRERLGPEADGLAVIPVRQVMTWAVVRIRPEADLREAARLMYERKIGALPVVRRDRVIGIITETDVLKAFVDILGEGVLARPYRWAFSRP